MPDYSTPPVYDKCTSCAVASEKGSAHGPWPTSHTDVCCLYKFHRQEHSGSSSKAYGFCKLPPPEPPRSNVTSPQVTRGLKIKPRMRRGFTKLTIEIRPPRFKKKLWFGTYEEEEIDRAKDAINFYMGFGEPFILPDSPSIFAQHPLGIHYRDLKPSCEDFLHIGQSRVRSSVYFARRVKEVIKAVTRGHKKKKPASSKNPKPGSSKKKLKPESPPATHTPPPSESPSSTMVACPSGSPFSSGDDVVWNGEAECDLLLMESELLSLCDWRDDACSLEGIAFSSSPSAGCVGCSGEGDGGVVDDHGFSASLWSSL